MRFYVAYDPAPALQHLKCPVLALNGSKDLQVPPAENLAGMRAALARLLSLVISVSISDGATALTVTPFCARRAA